MTDWLSKLKIASVIKTKGEAVIQVLEIKNNNYILFLPIDSDIEIYSKLFQYHFGISKSIHSKSITKVCELKNGYLVTTSKDETIKVLNVDYINKKYDIIQKY